MLAVVFSQTKTTPSLNKPGEALTTLVARGNTEEDIVLFCARVLVVSCRAARAGVVVFRLATTLSLFRTQLNFFT